MLKNRDFVASRRFAYHVPGEVVTCRVLNPLENRSTKGKARPAILLRREGARWLVAGLTSRSHFASGALRTRVPNPAACGLCGERATFVWGTPTWVCALDIGDHIGYADADLLALVMAA